MADPAIEITTPGISSSVQQAVLVEGQFTPGDGVTPRVEIRFTSGNTTLGPFGATLGPNNTFSVTINPIPVGNWELKAWLIGTSASYSEPITVVAPNNE